MTMLETKVETRAPWLDFAHTGPGTLAGHYLRSYWHPVQNARDLEAGKAKPIRIMSEDFTLYRGVSGEVHLVDFRCAHRGTQLSTGWVEGEKLRCFYHGWVYDGSGQCVEQPAEPEPFCQRIKIKSYPVQEYLGLVFAYLGEGEAPPLPRYEEFERPGVVVNGPPNLWPCNYFNRLENSPDPVHLAFAHRSSPFTVSGLIDIPQVSGEETTYGIEVHAARPGEKVRITHFHMPNMNLIANSGGAGQGDEGVGNQINLSWRVPVDDESNISFNANWIPQGEYEADQASRRGRTRPEGYRPARELAEAVLRGELHVDDIAVPTAIVNVQDYVAQIGQGAIAPREDDHLGRSDVMVILLRQIWERELRNLAEGRPITRWHREGAVTVTYGA